jgi:hypothetical protein
MLVRTLGATAVATALVLLPTVAHASGGEHPTSVTVVSPSRTAGVVVAAPAVPTSTPFPTGSLVTVGLVVLVGGALCLVLTGRRPDDDEPVD